MSEEERLSITDPLTGAWNRRYLEPTLAAEATRAERYGHPFSLLVIDIDQYKAVNDRHGHVAGDRVLIELAARIGRCTRSNVDVLARMGGDEFVLVLPETGLEAGSVVAGKLVGLVRATPIQVGNLEIAVTVSVGVAAYPEHGRIPGQLLAAADEALYRAKARGRDRVEEATVASSRGGAPAA